MKKLLEKTDRQIRNWWFYLSPVDKNAINFVGCVLLVIGLMAFALYVGYVLAIAKGGCQ